MRSDRDLERWLQQLYQRSRFADVQRMDDAVSCNTELRVMDL